MAEPYVAGSFVLEKWFDIQGFANFTAAHFVKKCHTVDSSQKSHLRRLHFRSWASKGQQRPPWILKMSAKKGSFLSFEWEKTNFTTLPP